MKRKRRQNPFSVIGDVFSEYGQNGNKTRAIRQLTIQVSTSKRMELLREANIFANAKRLLKIRR